MTMCANCAKCCVFFLCIVLAVSPEVTSDTSSGYYGKKAVWILYLDYAAQAIAKAKNSSVTLLDSMSGQKEALVSYLEIADEMINKAKINFLTCDNFNIPPRRILDCSDLLRMGHRRSGVHTISPKKITEKGLNVYCDMETDRGGWTVIQRRGDFKNPRDYFYRDWKSYKEGFGVLDKEFWLGNENIFALTNQEKYSVRFDLMDAENNTRYAHYDVFWIDGENSKYKLHISNYSGDAGDSMHHSKFAKFSTKDQDNDVANEVRCTALFGGAWWFGACARAHLNGEGGVKGKGGEGDRKDWSPAQGQIWMTWKGHNESLAWTEIKIRPKYFRP